MDKYPKYLFILLYIIRYNPFLVLTCVKRCINIAIKSKKNAEKFCWFLEKLYLCTRLTGNVPVNAQKKEFFERFT